MWSWPGNLGDDPPMERNEAPVGGVAFRFMEEVVDDQSDPDSSVSASSKQSIEELRDHDLIEPPPARREGLGVAGARHRRSSQPRDRGIRFDLERLTALSPDSRLFSFSRCEEDPPSAEGCRLVLDDDSFACCG